MSYYEPTRLISLKFPPLLLLLLLFVQSLGRRGNHSRCHTTISLVPMQGIQQRNYKNQKLFCSFSVIIWLYTFVFVFLLGDSRTYTLVELGKRRGEGERMCLLGERTYGIPKSYVRRKKRGPHFPKNKEKREFSEWRRFVLPTLSASFL